MAPSTGPERQGVAGSQATSGWRWTLLGAGVGMMTSAALSAALGLERRAFVAAWAAVVALLWASYAHDQKVRLQVQLARHWPAGLVVGVGIGALLAWTVARQPASTPPTGLALVADLLWLGVVYGTVDALILSVLPVLALYGTRSAESLRTPVDRVRRAAVALAGSALITAAYHLGFREFQGAQVILPVLGGLLTTTAYLLSGSALAPILAHVVMHVAAVLHGAATTVQLPPHY